MSTECIVPVAADSDFTLDNLPYGVFTTPDIKTGRIGVAIGGKILDLFKIHQLFDGPLMHDHKVIRGHPQMTSCFIWVFYTVLNIFHQRSRISLDPLIRTLCVQHSIHRKLHIRLGNLENKNIHSFTECNKHGRNRVFLVRIYVTSFSNISYCINCK